MKSLLAFAALLSLAACCQERELTYRYETQVVSGLTPNSPLRTGIKLSATASTQVYCRKSEVKVQLTDVVIYKIDQPLMQVKPESETIPNEFLKELVGENPDQFVRALQIPFAFELTKGLVSKLKFEDNDWTIDVKKGFISLFEVNLEKKLLLEDEIAPVEGSDSQQTTQYTVLERSTTGDCATKYVVRPLKSSAMRRMSVDKVRDYSRCLSTPGYRKSPFFEGIQVVDSVKANPLTQTSIVRYILKDNIITSAIGEERIIFKPTYSPTETEEVRTTINQTLVLFDSAAISSPLPDITMSRAGYAYHKLHHLEMSLPVESSVNSEEQDDERKFSPLVYSVDKIVTELRLVAENVAELTSKESLLRMRVVMEMLRTCPYGNMQKAYEALSRDETPRDRFAREVLWNALSNVGTETAAKYVLDVCAKDPAMTTNCSWALGQLVLTAPSTPAIIYKIMNLLKSEAANTPMLRMKIHLTLGSFAYKLNSNLAKEMIQLEEATNMLTPLLTEEQKSLRKVIKDKLRIIEKKKNGIQRTTNTMSGNIMRIFSKMLTENSVKDQILALKAIRNSGLLEAVPVLRDFILNEEVKVNSPYLRVAAVIAHCKIAGHPLARPEIRDLMMNLLMDTKEANEIRTAAFTVLMNMNPDLPLLEIIATRMNSEKDLHLSSYVVSFLQSYANSTFAPVMPFAKNASVALKSAPEYITGTGHSFYKFGGYFNEKYRMGSAFKLASRGSMDRFMSWNFDLDTVLFGVSTTPVSVQVDTQGISSLLNKLLGPQGMKTVSTSLAKILKSNPLKINPKQLLLDIITGLKMEPRAIDQFYGQAQVHIFGHELMYFESIKDIVEMIIPGAVGPMKMTDNVIESTIPLNFLKAMYVIDVKLTLPTGAGFPVSLQTLITNSHKVNGHMNMLATLPQPTSGVNSPMPSPKFGMDIDINKKTVTGVYATMGLDSFLTKATVGFHGLLKSNAPMRKGMTIDMLNGMIVNSVRLPQQDEPIFETYFEPVSEFLILYNNNGSPSMEYTSRPIYAAINERVTPIHIKLPCPFLGQTVQVTGQSPLQSFYPIPLTSLLRGKSAMKFTLIPGIDASYDVTFQAKVMTTHDLSENEQTSSALETDYEKDIVNDLSSLTMPKVVRKLIKISGANTLMKTCPCPRDMALVLSVDASTESVTKKMLAEFIKTKAEGVNHEKIRMLRLWVSPIPGWSNQPWQILGDFNVTSTRNVYQPEDIYSTEWQRQLFNDLKFLTSTNTESDANIIKVLEGILKMTMVSSSEQLYEPVLYNSPASRALDGMIPNIYFKKNMTTPIPEHILDVFSKVQEESKMIVDPYVIKRNVIVMELLGELIEAKQSKLETLKKFIGDKKPVELLDLIYTQWTMMKKEHTLAMLHDIVTKYNASGVVTNMEQIVPQLEKSSKLLVTLLKNMQTVLLQKPLTCSSPEAFSRDEKSKVTLEPLGRLPEFNVEDLKTTDVDAQTVLKYIQQLCLMQIKEIVNIHEKINQREKVDIDTLFQLMLKFDKILTKYESVIRSDNLHTEPLYSFVVLSTIQNELLVKLWQHYMNHVFVIYNNELTTQEMNAMTDVDLIIKSLSFKLSGSISHSAMTHKFSVMLGGKEDENTRRMREKMLFVQRNMMTVASRFLNIRSVYTDVSAMQEMINKLYTSIDEMLTMISETVGEIQQSTSRPNILLMSSVFDATARVSHLTKLCRQRIVSFTAPERIAWIQQLDKRRLDIVKMVHGISSTSLDFKSGKFMTQPSYQSGVEYLEGKHFNIDNVMQPPKRERIYQAHAPDVYKMGPTHIAGNIDDVMQGPRRIVLPNKVMHEAPNAYKMGPAGIAGNLNIRWGNALDKTINVKGFSMRSLEQIMWFMKQLNPSAMSRDLVSAITERMNGQVAVKESFKDIFNTYNHIYMEASVSSQMPRWVKDFATSMQETLKYKLWNFYTRHTSGSVKDKITTQIDVSEINNKIDFIVESNGEIDAFVDVPLNPYVFKSVKPTQTLRPVSHQFIEYVSGGFTPATCSIHGNQVLTFDQVSYRLPETVTSCRSLLAMDCSSDPSFFVSMVPSQTVSGARTLEINSLRKLVKLTTLNNVLEISVNNEPIAVRNNTPVFAQDLIIEKHGLEVIVQLPKVGVTVTVKGAVMVLKVSQLFKSKMCGLCGNFDGQKTWEFEGPLKEIYQNKTSFALSYVVPDSACPASIKPALVLSDIYPVPKPMHVDYTQILKEKFTATAEDKVCSVNMRTKVKKFRKKSLVCFSSKPITECSFDCDADKIQIQRSKILYSCFDSKSQKTNKLLQDVRKGRVLEKEHLEGFTHQIYRHTPFEKNCVV